jgi:hypothetical protein
MTLKSTRAIVWMTFLAVLCHGILAHHEHQNIIDALTKHQEHSIAALAEINTTIANGILIHAEATQNKAYEFAEDAAEALSRPTATPRVITKTRTRIVRPTPTPKPFRLFGPNR